MIVDCNDAFDDGIDADLRQEGCFVCGFPREDCICEPSVGYIGKEYFHIDTEERAEWLVGKLASLEAEQERVKSNAAEIVDRLRRQHDGLLKRFGTELEEFCRAKRSGKSKTVHFLQGKCAWRTTKTGGAYVADPAAALDYCQEHDEMVDACVTVSYRLRGSEYLKQFEGSGEVLPGIEVAPISEVERFYVNGTRLEVPEVER